MKLGDSRYRSNAITSQLSELLALGRVDVDKAIHISNAEALNAIARTLLPLSTETGESD